MEQGAKSLLRILLVALLIGGAVIGLKPAYRQAFIAILHGQPQESPIWQSNRAYYPDIALPSAPAEKTSPADAPADVP